MGAIIHSTGTIRGRISPDRVINGSVTDEIGISGSLMETFLKGEKGEKGDKIELRVENNILQYKYESDEEWIDLFDFTTLLN